MGGGSGGRIAVYATSSYTYRGIMRAFGGSGPATAANGAPGTIYTEIGVGGALYVFYILYLHSCIDVFLNCCNNLIVRKHKRYSNFY
jgi:hypothetical protein